jgi:hypothetical protein
MRFYQWNFASILLLSASYALASTPAARISVPLDSPTPANFITLPEPSEAAPSDLSNLPDEPSIQLDSQSTTQSGPQQTTPANTQDPELKQTKRILFIIPNFRSVSANQKLPPLTPKDKFKLLVSDTFDYSSFVEVGLIAGFSDLHKGEPEFGHGAVAYGRYYWHGLADAIDANFWVEYAIPVVAHEDPRYYTLGHGGFVKRTVYSVSRLVITRSDAGRPTPNFAEIVGNGAASGISNFYYPRSDRDWTKTGQRWVLQVGVDGIANLVKEFWPDINDKLFHGRE